MHADRMPKQQSPWKPKTHLSSSPWQPGIELSVSRVSRDTNPEPHGQTQNQNRGCARGLHARTETLLPRVHILELIATVPARVAHKLSGSFTSRADMFGSTTFRERLQQEPFLVLFKVFRTTNIKTILISILLISSGFVVTSGILLGPISKKTTKASQLVLRWTSRTFSAPPHRCFLKLSTMLCSFYFLPLWSRMELRSSQFFQESVWIITFLNQSRCHSVRRLHLQAACTMWQEVK